MNKFLKKNDVYCFDTNAIYYFCGQDLQGYDIEKFRNDFKQMNFKIIPSCVLQEMVVKYRNNMDDFGIMMNILAENNFKIAPSQYDYLGDNFWEEMLENMDDAVNKQFEKKIDNESRLIYLFSFFVSMVYIRALAIQNSIPNIENFMEIIFETCIKRVEEEKIKYIINELRNAYDIDNTEKRIKEIYLEIIYEYSIWARLYVDSIIKGYSISNVDKHLNDFENEKEVKKMINSKDCFNKFITSYCKKNFSVLTDAINVIPSFFEKKKYTPEQIDYIRKKLELLLKQNAKLEKNDIYDIFYLFSYSDYYKESFNLVNEKKISKSDIKLITFDARVLKEVSNFSSISKEIIDYYKK